MTERFAKAGISLVAISTESSGDLQKSAAKSKDESGFPFPLLSDADLKVFKSYRAFDDFEQIPLHGTFLVDGAGRIRWQDVNFEPFKHTEFLLGEAQRLLTQDGVPSLRAAKVSAAPPLTAD
jgi:peroxiredoxin